MVENPFIALTFIAGPAVLTNACAIMQNSATMRYTMAITQWREFRTALAAGDQVLVEIYADADLALTLAERRIRFLLRGLNLVYAAVGLFGLTALLGLLGATLAVSDARPDVPIGLVAGAGGAGLLALLVAVALFTLESRCSRAMLALQLQASRSPSRG